MLISIYVIHISFFYVLIFLEILFYRILYIHSSLKYHHIMVQSIIPHLTLSIKLIEFSCQFLKIQYKMKIKNIITT